MSNPQISLNHGGNFPYDAPDKWWDGTGENPPAPDDWAHAAARGVAADLQGRGGIKHGFDNIDEDIRTEIISSLAAIIRLAAKGKEPTV